MSDRNRLTKYLAPVAFCLFFFHGLAALAQAADHASVGKDNTVIRSAPNTKAEPLWEVFKGFPLEIVKKQKTWTKIVDFEGADGWLPTQSLAAVKTVIVKVKNANLRVGPGIDYEEIAAAKYGVVFTVLAREKEWLQVKHETGISGWINRDLIWPDKP